MIFVFGSNEAGRHGKGAALCALKEHGAIHGRGVGPQGNSYAIPTKDKNIKTLPLDRIKYHVDVFLVYARDVKEDFNLTPIGCGLADYEPKDIAPMFINAPYNVRLPKEFYEYLIENRKEEFLANRVKNNNERWPNIMEFLGND